MRTILLLVLLLLGFSSYAQEINVPVKRLKFNAEVFGSGIIGSLGISKEITPKLELGIKGLFFPAVQNRISTLGFFAVRNFERTSRVVFTLEAGLSYVGSHSKTGFRTEIVDSVVYTFGQMIDQFSAYLSPGVKMRITNSFYLGLAVYPSANIYTRNNGESKWIWEDDSLVNRGMFNSRFWIWPSLKASFIL